MYYCNYDINSGAIQQWLNSSINSNIPTPNLEVTQQEFENQNLYEYVINGTTLSLTPPTTYYIDEYGDKYSVQLQSTYQPLQCNFNDLLLYQNNQWVVATSLQQAAYNTKNNNKTFLNNFLKDGYYYSPSLLTFLNFSEISINSVDSLLKINNSSSNIINLRLLDNVNINISYTQLQTVYNEMLNFKMNIYNMKWNLENLINTISNLSNWQPNTSYNLDDYILDSNGNVERVVNAGTSGNTIPNFNIEIYEFTVDNTITWKNISTPIDKISNHSLMNIYDLLNTSQWQSNFNYNNYQYIVFFNDSDYSYTLYKCLQNGTSGNTIPSFINNNSIGSIIQDNNITWLCLGEQIVYLSKLVRRLI